MPSAATTAAPKIPWFAAGVVGLVCAAYANSLGGPFVFDDTHAILDNPTIRSLSWPALAPPRGGGLTVEGRPVLNLTLALNYALSGTRVWSYHLVNLVIHAGAALALFGVIRRTLVRLEKFSVSAAPLAFLAAGLWALHPLQTESVTYVVQRTESLMGLLFLTTLYCALRQAGEPHRRRWTVFAVASCWLGMATKEVMVAAPLLVLLYDRTFLAGTFREAWRLRARLHLGLALSWLLLGFLVVTTGDRGGTIGAAAGVSPWDYLLSQSRAIMHYLRLTVWPDPLVFDYGPDFVSFARALPFAVADVGLVVLTAVALRRRPALGFVGAWFFVILAPTSSFVGGTRQMLAEHRMYLSLAAPLVLAVVGLHRWLGRRSWVLWGVAAAALGTVTVARNRDYRSELAIFGDTVAKRPGNAYARNNYGSALVAAGRHAESAEQFATAARLLPTFAQAHNNLSGALYRLGRPADCLEHAATAVRLQPNYPEAHANLGTARLRLGDPAAAIPHFQTALRLKPDYADALGNLGAAYLQAGRPAEAAAQYLALVRLAPERSDAHYSLGVVRQQSGDLASAIPHYEAALRHRPDYPEAHSNLCLVLLQLNRAADGIAHGEAAVRLAPGFADAHYNLALALSRAARLPDALRHFEHAVRLAPDQADARFQLANALYSSGRPAEAVPHYEFVARAQPANPDAHNNLGSALFQATDRIDDAIACFRTALRLKPGYSAAHSNLGVALLAQHRTADAIAHFDEALRLDATNADAAQHLERLRTQRP
ncbi:MAG: tetratricopeptide repeat protein [Verrucomicrobia bacterium]|nr:tetratricopeptide repeat protein [Verrucomicrobiota bacterium]